MSDPIVYVEILSDSRSIEATPSSTKQSIVIEFKLPLKEDDSGDLADPVFDSALGLFLGAEDDILALETAYNIIPLTKWMPNQAGTALLLILDSLSVKQVSNHDWWRAEANYVFDENTGKGGQGVDSEGDPETEKTLPFIKIGFRAGGGSERITESLYTYPPVKADGEVRDIPDTKRAIGVTADGVEGTEVITGGLYLQITAYYYPSAITIDFVKELASLFKPKGRAVVNDNWFLGYNNEDVLLTDFEGSATIGEVVPITFNFIIKEDNSTNADEGFPNFDLCRGHNIVDYRYIKEFDPNAKTQIQKPAFRFVHRVYEAADFTILGLPAYLYAAPTEEP